KSGSKRPAFEQFRMQGSKRVDVVDVVPGRQQMDRDTDFPRPLERLPRDPLGAPRDVLKQAAMQHFDSKKIVTTVRRGAEYHTISWLSEDVSRFDKQRRWQCRAVGVHYYRALVATVEQLLQRTTKAGAEIRMPGFEQTEVERNLLREKFERVAPR